MRTLSAAAFQYGLYVLLLPASWHLALITFVLVLFAPLSLASLISEQLSGIPEVERAEMIAQLAC